MNEVNVPTDVHTDVAVPSDKHAALGTIATILSAQHPISDELRTNLIAREDESTTDLVMALLIPHAKVNGLTDPLLVS